MTLFLVAILTLMLTAAFARVQSDRRIAEGSEDNVNAVALARAGLHQYMGTRGSPTACTPLAAPPDGDSVRINLTGGYADVIARVVRKPVDPEANWLFVVRSVGHVVDPVQGADPQAIKTVAQFAQWQTGKLDVAAALTAAKGLNWQALSVVFLDGNDQSTCGSPNVYALRVPAVGYTAPLANINILGVLGINVMSGGPSVVANATNIDWGALISGGFTADYSSLRLGDNTYPSQFIDGDLTINNGTGFGLLIVTGNLTMNNANWFGPILVGSRVMFSGVNGIYGAIFTGLGEQTPWPAHNTLKGSLGNLGLTSIQYNRAFINLSLATVTGFAPITNGWVDNWASF